ncbi:unnamed protein product [Clonostachys rosea]|uniref:NACHT domain-containing protein n=1 Tax=Bionectria ochroleuca TaxID=29856 RepID=A0ABY6UD62_BIOOC|nr:unnamed protein product [Clonostachys rosea]
MSTDERSWDDDVVVVDQTDLDDFNELGILPVSPETEAEIRSWLRPTKYNAENGEFRKHQRSHLAGTGDWIRQTASYTEWHDSDDRGMLWIKGIPGSGKSVVAASLIERLSQEEQAPTLFFFFRQIIDANHAPAALLRDWLDQILSYSPPLQAQLKKEYIDKSRKVDEVSMNDLWGELKLALGSLPRLFCVVDALDEMDKGNDEFLKALADLGRWRPSNVKVIVTSRPVPAVEKPLQQIPMLHIRLDESHVDVDIATYVDYCLKNSSIPEIHHGEIKKAVPGRANGLFLYAKLAMDAFRQEGADIAQVLEQLPLDLNVMYTNLLREHGKNSGVPDQLQLLILSWVTHASRPLRLLEMAEMINVTQQTEFAGDFKGLKSLVRAACGPLLEILPDETVCVIHHSLTEFLNGSTRQDGARPTEQTEGKIFPVLHAGSTHTQLARVCIDYLLRSKCLETVKLDEVKNVPHSNQHLYGQKDQAPAINQEIRADFPFVAYCLDNWHVHLRKAEKDLVIPEDLHAAVDNLLSDTNGSALQTLTDPKMKGHSSLHFTAGFGLGQYVSRLLEKNDIGVDSVEERGDTAMLYASKAGHANVVKVLLARGADADKPSESDGLKPLHGAAKNNHGEVVSILLASGVSLLTEKTKQDPDSDPLDDGTAGMTPLEYAAKGGQEDAIGAFLPYIKDAQTASRALAWAACCGHPNCVKRILSHELVNVNARVGGDTPLFIAGESGDVHSMILLLQAGADPSILSWGAYSSGEHPKDEDSDWDRDEDDPGSTEGLTPLQALCGVVDRYNQRKPTFQPYQVRQLLKLMIEAGADLDARTPSGWAAIIGATKKFPELVRPLLEAGADVSIINSHGENVLHECRDPDIVQILVEVGKADINQVSTDEGMTPFLQAVYEDGCASAVLIKKLAELGADVAATDYYGRGAFHILFKNFDFTLRISEEERLEIVKAMLEVGVPVNLQDNNGCVALHHLMHSFRLHQRFRDGKYDQLIQVMIDAGADINIQDYQGLTPLALLVKHAEGEASVEAVREFVSLGADPLICDFHERNLLHYCREREEELMVCLIEMGCSPDNCDRDGNPLKWGTHHVNKQGRTHLHLLASSEGWSFSGMSAVSLSEYPNVDCGDNDGIRPLHLVCRKDEGEVIALLKAGASPTKPTNGGVTPIHVAARFRKPNIIGLLLEAIEKQSGKEAVARHLNSSWRPTKARLSEGVPSPLHFACRSGLPESVALLLEAGADPNLCADRFHTPLYYCTKFEEEERLWAEARSEDSRSPYILDVPFRDPFGIAFNDKSRVLYRGAKHVSDLEEVLDLLVLHGVSMETNANPFSGLDGAIIASEGQDYTTECLFKLQQRLEARAKQSGSNDEDTMTLPPIEEYVEGLMKGSRFAKLSMGYSLMSSIYRRSATRKAFVFAEKERYESDDVLHLIEDHHWDLLRHLARRDPSFFGYNLYGKSHFSEIVDAGLYKILGEILTKQRLVEMEEYQDEAVQGWVAGKAQYNQYVPPACLLRACERPSPNMPMIRLLIEKMGVDVNYQTAVCRFQGEDRSWKKGSSALHFLARGLNWWHYAHGLKYLIERRADLELRDEEGRTPLHRALANRRTLEPARVLIEAGADVNAVNDSGKSCLAYAGNKLEAIKLLLGHGAVAKLPALFEAIWDPQKKAKFNPEAFDALCAVVDPNARLSKTELESLALPWNDSWRSQHHLVDDDQIYPLYLATSRNPIDTFVRWGSINRQSIEKKFLPIIEAVVRNGADPFVRYQKRRVEDLRAENPSTIEATLLHDILEEGALTEPVLRMPNLDLERRDAMGRTLLLAACRSRIGPDTSMDAINPKYRQHGAKPAELFTKKPSIVKFLVDKGACVTATDNNGMNALHHILLVRPEGGHDSLKLLLSVAPELALQVNAFGASPLHFALRRSVSHQAPDTQSIRMLLDAGADPSLVGPTGNTALHHLGMWLADKGTTDDMAEQPCELFKHLVACGLDVNSRNEKGETPLFLFMLSQGVDRDSEKINGDLERQSEAIRTLVDAGSDLFTTNSAGDTLLHAVAASSKNLQNGETGELMIARFKWLLEQGLDPTIENIRHQTCLDVAAANENDMILKLFERKQ